MIQIFFGGASVALDMESEFLMPQLQLFKAAA